MNHRSSWPLAFALVLFPAFAPAVARADALPPPTPINCGPGSTRTHDHSGTHCVKNAPTNCPAGWQGVSGGTCALALCAPGAACGAGKTCKPVALCSHDETTYGYGENDGPVRGSLLGGPPSPRSTRLFTQPCGPENACPGKDKCRGAHVCLPADAAAPAMRPKNASPAYSYDLSRDDPPPTEYAPPPPAASNAEPPPAPSENVEPVAVSEPRPPGKSGGCAGCTIAPPRSSAWPILAALACVVVLVRRRR